MYAADDLGEDSYKDFKRMDIGDIVGVKGFVFTTKMGEISVHAHSGNTALQELTDPSGEVPRTHKHRYPLPSEIR